MSVYVDPLIDYGWKLGPSCHLIADTVEELHTFAATIGMKRSWFQLSRQEMPHYDLTARRRADAVKKGAIEINRRETVDKLNAYLESRG